MIPIQPITIVSSGGTPMQLCDQKGAPYPTTGFGALVFNTGPTLIDAILLNPLITFDVIKLPGGDFYNPSLQFTADNSKTPGLYSTGPGNISLVGTNGDESSRALLASFDHPGNLHVANLLNIGGTIPPADSSTLVATTKWVNDQGYLTTATAGTTYLPLTGGTLTGPLTGTTATFTGSTVATPLTVRTTVAGASYVDIGNLSTATNATSYVGTQLNNVSNGYAFWGVVNGSPNPYAFITAGAGLTGGLVIAPPTTHQAALTGTTATFVGAEKVMSATAIPAGGTAGAGYLFSSTANFGMIFGSGAPTAAMARGSIYLRSDGGGPYVNTDGATTWAVMGGGGGASLTISDTPPGSPTAGAMWWNSVLGTLMVYYNDGNSSQWVPATPTMAGSYLPLAGGTLTGPLNITGAAGTARGVTLMTAGLARWNIVATATAEGGSSAGSNLGINAFDDTGAFLGQPLAITRSTGAVTLTGALTGTTATFSGALSASLAQISSATKGIRLAPGTTGSTIMGTDQTGTGSYQPLTIDALTTQFLLSGALKATLDGSGFTLGTPLIGTTATFSGAAQALKLGVGMAPSLTATSNIWATGDITFNSTNHFIGGNLYYDSGWKYTANGTGATVQMAQDATHPLSLITAPNNVGGAGAAATPFTALSFDASGNATFFGTLTAASLISGPGAQLQMVSVETGAVATGTTVIPNDDTIPQQTEGDQYMTLAITPKSATSKLIIEVVWNGSNSAASTNIIAALFQDATANALAVGAGTSLSGAMYLPIGFRHVMTSGTTSATTFKVRVGGTSAGTTTFNGQSGARTMGGVMASSIVIREVAP